MALFEVQMSFKEALKDLCGFLTNFIFVVIFWSSSDQIVSLNCIFIALGQKQLTKFCVGESMVIICVVAHEDEFRLLFNHPIRTFHRHIYKQWDKFFALYVSIFFLIESLKYLEQVKALFLRKLTLNLFSLFLHKNLVLEELR